MNNYSSVPTWRDQTKGKGRVYNVGKAGDEVRGCGPIILSCCVHRFFMKISAATSKSKGALKSSHADELCIVYIQMSFVLYTYRLALYCCFTCIFYTPSMCSKISICRHISYNTHLYTLKYIYLFIL